MTNPSPTRMLFRLHNLSFQNMDKRKQYFSNMLRNPVLYGEGCVGCKRDTSNPVCSVLNDSDPYFLRVPCWKVTLFVVVPVLGPLVALIICYNWLHRRLAGAVVGCEGV